jgi:hypothetical protein
VDVDVVDGYAVVGWDVGHFECGLDFGIASNVVVVFVSSRVAFVKIQLIEAGSGSLCPFLSLLFCVYM